MKENIHQEGIRLLNGRSKPYLIIAPTANWEAKIWPSNNYACIAKNLMNSNYFKGGTVVIVGGPGEESIGENIVSEIGDINLLNLIGEPILPTAAIFSYSRLYIGNDSGLMHLSAAMGTPTLGLFGPTDDRIYSPVGKNSMIVRTPESPSDLMSDSSFNHRTSGSLMKTLSIDRVETAAHELLSRTNL